MCWSGTRLPVKTRTWRLSWLFRGHFYLNVIKQEWNQTHRFRNKAENSTVNCCVWSFSVYSKCVTRTTMLPQMQPDWMHSCVSSCERVDLVFHVNPRIFHICFYLYTFCAASYNCGEARVQNLTDSNHWKQDKSDFHNLNTLQTWCLKWLQGAFLLRKNTKDRKKKERFGHAQNQRVSFLHFRRL